MAENAAFIVACVNVRSLPQRRSDVLHDTNLVQTKLLFLTETWMHPSDSRELPGYRYVCGAKWTENEAAGVAIYVKNAAEATPLELEDQFEVGEMCGVRLPTCFNILCAYIARNVSEANGSCFVIWNIPLTLRHRLMILVGDFNQNAQTNSNFLHEIDRARYWNCLWARRRLQPGAPV